MVEDHLHIGQTTKLEAAQKRVNAQIGSLQAGRFFAAAIVVCFHANLTTALPKYFGVEPFPFLRSGYAGVEFFFVLSGFVIGLNHLDDVMNGGSVARFAWKRFRRVYPALWVVLTGMLLLFAIMPNGDGKNSLDAFGVIGSYALAPYLYPNFSEPILVVIWSLRFEVLFYVLTAITIFHKPSGFALWGLLIAISFMTVFNDHESNGIFSSPYPILFAMGFLASAIYRLRQPRFVFTAAIGGALGFCAAWIMAMSEPGGYIDNKIVLIFGLSSCIIILVMALHERSTGKQFPGLLILLGDASYAIYLTHYPVISICMKILKSASNHVPISPHIALIVAIAAAIGVGLIFHMTVERYLLKVIPARLGRKAVLTA